jgi:hypothetical protein
MVGQPKARLEHLCLEHRDGDALQIPSRNPQREAAGFATNMDNEPSVNRSEDLGR